MPAKYIYRWDFSMQNWGNLVVARWISPTETKRIKDNNGFRQCTTLYGPFLLIEGFHF